MDKEGKRNQVRVRPVLIFFITIVGLLLITAMTQAESGDAIARPTPSVYPGRPTRESNGDPETTTVPVGALIELQAEFDENWLWYELPWYDLWTVVQWGDGAGNWYDVTGWRGNPDEIKEKDGIYTAYKVWWLPELLYGNGPFRWVVYTSEGGEEVVTSDEFYLPNHTGGVTRVPVLLEVPDLGE